MRSGLQDLWDGLEARRWRLLEAVGRLPAELQTKPVPGSEWTPLEIIEHVILAEELNLQEIAAAAQATGVAKPGLKYKALVLALRRGIRMPAPESMKPTGGFDLQALGARWDRDRAALAAALELENDTRPFSVNAFLGHLGAEHVLELADAHLQYHQKQLGAL